MIHDTSRTTAIHARLTKGDSHHRNNIDTRNKDGAERPKKYTRNLMRFPGDVDTVSDRNKDSREKVDPDL